MSEIRQTYCVKCREKRNMVNPTPVYTKTGRPGTSGTCEICGTKMFVMGATPEHENIPKPEIVEAPKRAKKTKATKKGKKRTASTKQKTRSPRRKGKLVIVESPAKARSVGRFLGNGYTVKASKGHVRDLLKSQISVDVENDFEPRYRVPNDKRDTIKELKKDVERAEEIFLATDPDREGEAIAWHLIAATDMDENRVKRVVFHEITDDAVNHAFEHPRELNLSLVDAQQARRILDRVVGYNLTELLWDRVRNRLSAGRVQSIALRLVVDREKEIEAFTAEEYWTVDAELEKETSSKKKASFIARLVKINGDEPVFNSEDDVKPHVDTLKQSQFIVQDVKRGTRQRKPSPPFTTSTLQQEASRRFGFNARRTMMVAQQLYEGINLGDKDGFSGFITYMRTDSTNVSDQAQKEAKTYIHKRFGKDFAPAKAPQYKTKAKGAQEAHEAIRPTDIHRVPDTVKDLLTRDQYKLYTLIWERFIASQMSNAVYNTVRVEIGAGKTSEDMPYLLRVSGRTIKFLGFLALYEETRDEDLQADEDEGRILPDLDNDELLRMLNIIPLQHFTQPPPRYTEATLVKTLEEYGIGRPSTYAPTVAVIQDRDYVEKQDKRLTPTETGKVVNDLLVEYFPNIMDYQFTARMEGELDHVAEGNIEWRPMLREFYNPFEKQLKNARQHMPRVRQEEKVGRDCPQCEDGELIIKYGRWGKFIGCTNYPECNYTEQYLERTGVACPLCGDEHQGEIVVRKTRRGSTFYGCNRYPECEYRAWKLPKQPKAAENEEDAELINEKSGS